MLKENFRYSAIILCIIIFIVFIFQITLNGFTDSLKLIGKDAFNRPWTLITSIFLHGSLEHLMYNLFALALFGIILENVIGTRKFLVLFFISGLIASIISSFFYNSALGASGAIYGILGALVVLRPTMQIWAYYIPMPMYIAGLVYFVVNFFGAYFGIGNTGYIAHLSGLVIGLMFGFILRKKFGEHRNYTHINESIDKYLDEYERDNKLRK